MLLITRMGQSCPWPRAGLESESKVFGATLSATYSVKLRTREVTNVTDVAKVSSTLDAHRSVMISTDSQGSACYTFLLPLLTSFFVYLHRLPSICTLIFAVLCYDVFIVMSLILTQPLL